MCGISAFISTRANAIDLLLDSIHELQNRGYDSAGIGFFQNTLQTRKYASTRTSTALEMLQSHRTLECHVGVAHTRWATHGAQTDRNSHPHVSSDGTVLLVHNGIIDNFADIKRDLVDMGYIFSSDTDSEVIVNLVASEYKRCGSSFEAIAAASFRMSGTWGLVIMFEDQPNALYCTRQGSPMLMSKNDDVIALVSEQSALLGIMSEYTVLKNGDICQAGIDASSHTLSLASREAYTPTRCLRLKTEPLGLYRHWTLKEIHDQRHTIHFATGSGKRTLNDRVALKGLDANRAWLQTIENIVILGCGTSLYAGMAAVPYFKRLCAFNTVQVFDGAEFELSFIPREGSTAALFLSQSGETRDLYRCLELIKGSGSSAKTIGVVNVVDSQIAREVDCGCYIHAGRERAVASTKSFTSQVVTLSLMALWFSQLHSVNAALGVLHLRDLRSLRPQLCHVLNHVEHALETIVDEVSDCHSMFVLGKGIMEPIAREGSLKIKEIAYIHAEGYSGGALKHGPFALLNEGVPVVMLIPDDEHVNKMMNAYEQVKSRGARAIVVTDSVKVAAETNAILYPRNESYSCVLCSVVLQYFAYLLSIRKGINPDYPRNLAKVVTVE